MSHPRHAPVGPCGASRWAGMAPTQRSSQALEHSAAGTRDRTAHRQTVPSRGGAPLARQGPKVAGSRKGRTLDHTHGRRTSTADRARARSQAQSASCKGCLGAHAQRGGGDSMLGGLAPGPDGPAGMLCGTKGARWAAPWSSSTAPCKPSKVEELGDVSPLFEAEGRREGTEEAALS